MLFASLNVLFYSSCQKEELSAINTPPDTASCMVDKDRVTQNLKNMSYGLIKALHTLGRGNAKTDDANNLATFNQIVVENAVRGLHGYYYVTNAGSNPDINYMNAFIRGRIMDYQIDVYDAP